MRPKCFYRSGSVLTPITGLVLSKTLLATSSMVPSPKVENKNMTAWVCLCATVAYLFTFLSLSIPRHQTPYLQQTQ